MSKKKKVRERNETGCSYVWYTYAYNWNFLDFSYNGEKIFYYLTWLKNVETEMPGCSINNS